MMRGMMFAGYSSEHRIKHKSLSHTVQYTYTVAPQALCLFSEYFAAERSWYDHVIADVSNSSVSQLSSCHV